MKKVAIIIVNWNTGGLLAKCLASIDRLPSDDRKYIERVVVVDNASSDKSLDQASEALLSVPLELIKLKRNLGFAGGNNVGITAITNRPRPHIYLLNPDTELTPGALPIMVSALKTSPSVGIVGSRLLNPDRTTQPSLRRFPTRRDFILYALKLGRLVSQPTFNYDQRQTVDQVMGASFLIRDELYNQIGGLDENYFVWFEEVDYCLTAQKKGWHTLYVPDAKVVHWGGASFSKLTGLKKTIPWLKSSLYYSKRHFGIPFFLTLIFLAPLTLIVSLPATLLHHRQRKQHTS